MTLVNPNLGTENRKGELTVCAELLGELFGSSCRSVRTDQRMPKWSQFGTDQT
jgi:hypothetical protein